jgi:hypothetical protein
MERIGREEPINKSGIYQMIELELQETDPCSLHIDGHKKWQCRDSHETASR